MNSSEFKESKKTFRKEKGHNQNKSKNWRELKAHKRKLKEAEVLLQLKNEASNNLTAEKKVKLDTSQKSGRNYTISIALPGSILATAQSRELQTCLVGQIARTAAVFNVDEIIVFDESGKMTKDVNNAPVSQEVEYNLQMIHILQYLECPQYLRKDIFPHHKFLQHAGLLHPLDCPHHMRRHEESSFREGIVLDKPVPPGQGSFVNVGLEKDVQIDRQLVPGVRVTVQLDPANKCTKGKRRGTAVSFSLPSESGIYWGYRARLATSLGAVFKDSPYEGGYDLAIGTSERGKSIDNFSLPKFRHMLIVFGGRNGLEASLDADPDLNANDPSELFHHYLNTCPGQGSRTIRTEEAILITLSALRMKVGSSDSLL